MEFKIKYSVGIAIALIQRKTDIRKENEKSKL